MSIQKTGTLVFVRGKRWWSRVIAKVTGSDFTHVAIVYNEFVVIESDGFKRVGLFAFVEEDYEVVDIGLNISCDELYDVARPYFNSEYDYLNIFSQLFRHFANRLPFIEIKNGYTCVELVVAILHDLHYEVQADTPIELYNKLKKG